MAAVFPPRRVTLAGGGRVVYQLMGDMIGFELTLAGRSLEDATPWSARPGDLKDLG
jgi:hypothetical protein